MKYLIEFEEVRDGFTEDNSFELSGIRHTLQRQNVWWELMWGKRKVLEWKTQLF